MEKQYPTDELLKIYKPNVYRNIEEVGEYFRKKAVIHPYKHESKDFRPLTMVPKDEQILFDLEKLDPNIKKVYEHVVEQ